MSSMPAVVVKKGGFLSAIAYGFFGLLMTTVICGSAIGFYAINVVDRHTGPIVSFVTGAISDFPQFVERLPGALGEAFHDRRAVEYCDQIETQVRIAEGRRGRHGPVAVVEVTNHGDEVVSLLALNITIEDANGLPLEDLRTYAATPVMFDEDDWRGLLLPGKTRKFVRTLRAGDLDCTAQVEIAEIRVTTPRVPAPPAAAPGVAMAADDRDD